MKDNNNVSMANEGFEHPCTLYVNDGAGVIQLRALPLSAKSGSNGKMVHGKVDKLEYFDSGRFISAELHGNVISFPAEALNFVNMGTGVGQVLHGSVCLKMQCSCGIIHMPESKAIFTILLKSPDVKGFGRKKTKYCSKVATMQIIAKPLFLTAKCLF